MDLTPEQLRFVDAVRKPEHKNRDVQLRKRFFAIPPEKRLDTLLYLFTNSNDYNDQQTAALFLPEVASEVDFPLEEFLGRVAPTWNLSVEELPHFLADVYGCDTVVDTSNALATQHEDGSEERRSLDTMAWWLKRRRNNIG